MLSLVIIMHQIPVQNIQQECFLYMVIAKCNAEQKGTKPSTLLSLVHVYNSVKKNE